MRSTRSTGQRLRSWSSPGAALILSFGLLLLPPGAKEGVATGLEWTLFFPFRYAVGWGPRSLAVERELARLSEQMTRWRLDQDRMHEVEAENQRLRGLLGFLRREDFVLTPGMVVSRGRARPGDLLVTRPADPDKVPDGSPVLGPDGLLGRVASRRGAFVRVECLTNRNVAVSVHNARTREGGILRWEPERRWPLVVQGVPVQADWQVGDRILTTGLGTVFPRGLLVGWVAGWDLDRSGMLRDVFVRPAASPGKAEEVFYLVGSESANPISGDEEPTLYPTDPGRKLSRQDLDGERKLSSEPLPVP